MMKKFKHQFSDLIPEDLNEGILYVSAKFNTVTHLCACGCKSEVVTPLSPSDWNITHNGKNITLYPSIGNWDLPCQSHYWIRNNEVEWAPKWSRERIERNRAYQSKNQDGSFWDIFKFY